MGLTYGFIYRMHKERRKYNINLSALEEGRNDFHFHLNQSFFDIFGYEEFDRADIDTEVVFLKNGNTIEVKMHAKGSVELPDDRTGHMYKQPLENQLDFIIQYGECFNDDNEELIIVPFNQAFFNIAQQLYEMTVLAIPMKHLDPEYRELAENDTIDNSVQEEEEINTDSPWKEQLMKLKEKLEPNKTK